jgi:hypothetical protein
LNVETICTDSRDCEADTVDRNRPFVDDVRRQLSGKTHGEPVEVRIGAHLLDVSDAVHVSLHEVYAEPAVGAERPLEIHDCRAPAIRGWSRMVSGPTSAWSSAPFENHRQAPLTATVAG